MFRTGHGGSGGVSRPRVVIIDDDAATLELIRDILEEDGFEVLVSTSVGADLRELWASRPDLLVVDLLLTTDPRGLSGWDVVRLARSHADLHRVPAIVISAHEPALRRHGLEARRMERIHLMLKPFGVDELRAVAKGLLAGASVLRRRSSGERSVDGTKGAGLG